MEQVTIQSLGFLTGFQEDIKLVVLMIMMMLIMSNMLIMLSIHHHHHHRRHLGLPGRSSRVRANLRGVL